MAKSKGCPHCWPSQRTMEENNLEYRCSRCGWTPATNQPDHLRQIQISLAKYLGELDAHKASLDRSAAELAELRTEIEDLISVYREGWCNVASDDGGPA